MVGGGSCGGTNSRQSGVGSGPSDGNCPARDITSMVTNNNNYL